MCRPDNVAAAASIIRFECAGRQFVRATVIATPIAFQFWLDFAAKKKLAVKLGSNLATDACRVQCVATAAS